MNIELEDYNIDKASVTLIKRLFDEKPFMKLDWYATELGVSQRTLLRHAKNNNIVIPLKKLMLKSSIETLIKAVELAGYNVIKK